MSALLSLLHDLRDAGSRLHALLIPRPQRQRLHRWLGLLTAAFLLLAGTSGALLTLYEPLDQYFAAELRRVEPLPGRQPIDPLVLADAVQARYPDALVRRAPLHGEDGQSLLFLLMARPGAVQPAVNQVFVDPWRGEILGGRRWGDLRGGTVNLMPFVFRLHRDLLLGPPGKTLLGLIALLWLASNIYGLSLTLPPPRAAESPRQRLRRWWPAWQLRRPSSRELHRAGGLWVWLLLLAFSLSSLAFNLAPAWRTLASPLGLQAHEISAAGQPLIEADWFAAGQRGRELMAAAAEREGFTVEVEERLELQPHSGRFIYQVYSDRDLGSGHGHTRLLFDGHSGEPLQLWLPRGAAAGDSLYSLLTTLHRGELGGAFGKLLSAVVGLAVAMLAVTGVLLWWRRCRQDAAQRELLLQAGRPLGIGLLSALLIHWPATLLLIPLLLWLTRQPHPAAENPALALLAIPALLLPFALTGDAGWLVLAVVLMLLLDSSRLLAGRSRCCVPAAPLLAGCLAVLLACGLSAALLLMALNAVLTVALLRQLQPRPASA